MVALTLRARDFFRSRTFFAGLASLAAGLLFSFSASAQGVMQLNPNLGVLRDLQIASPTRTVEIQQGNGLRFLDAHEDNSHDWAAVTRPYQNNTSQRWIMTEVSPGIVRLMQINTGRYLDAHEVADRGYRVVTRPFQNNSTQLWRLINYGGGFYAIQHVSSGRYLDNANNPAADFPVFTAAGMYDGEQNSTVWRIVDVN
ncbi:MAG: RICIN domain-containing protein [Bauldia sp.]|nr:RICIN domain-containing protein [Bauldia sp.]